MAKGVEYERVPKGAAITDEAREWEGWGTALKPACEPIVMARKPLSGTVASNVLEHGTGAINVGACRIGDEVRSAAFTSLAPCSGNRLGASDTSEARRGTQGAPKDYVGRWPANVIHDGSDEVVALFPDTASGGYPPEGGQRSHGTTYGTPNERGERRFTSSDGSASRFFYAAKADTGDRLGSGHPTVKPVDLMQWLIRLVTPKGGLVLDPFAGSGSTGEAAFREGMRCMMIERETKFAADIQRRIDLLSAGPDERSRETIKAKIADGRIVDDAGPLFAGPEIAPTDRPTDKIQRSQEQVLCRRGRRIGPTGLRR